MDVAIGEARRGIAAGQSPFGAVIVRGDRALATAHNEVRAGVDPSAHAEVVCIRRAARALGAIDLSGCEMYTTCEPCPMCAAAIHWARLDAVHFGACIDDARRAGFSELTLAIEEMYARGSNTRAVRGVQREACAALFEEWRRAGGVPY